MSTVQFKLASDPSQFLHGVQQCDQAQKGLAHGVNEFGTSSKKAYETAGTSTNGFKSAITSVGAAAAGAFSVGAIISFTQKIIETRAEFQKFEAVLTNTLGSNSAAKAVLSRIQEVASKTPFSVKELTESFVKLANQGFKPTNEELIKLGDLAASQGKSFDQLTEGIIDATSGEFERLKEFGIRAEKSGDKIKFTFKGVQTQTDFTADSIRKYVLGLGDLEGVSGGMAAISETLGGKISNLGDNFDAFFNNLGADTEGIMGSVLNKFNEFLGVLNQSQTAIIKIDTALKQAGGSQTAYDKLFGGNTQLVALQQNLDAITNSGRSNAEIIFLYGKSLDIIKKQYEKGTISQKEYSNSLLLIGAASKQLNETIKANKTAKVSPVGLSEAEIKKAKQAAEDLAKALEDLNKRSQKAELEGLSGMAKLNKQKEINEKELVELRASIQKKGELTNKNFKFTAEQEAEFSKLKLQINREYYSAVLQLSMQEAQAEAQVAKNKSDSALANLELENNIVKNGLTAIRATEGSSAFEKQVFEEERAKLLLNQELEYQQEKLKLVIAGIDAETNLKKASLVTELSIVETKTDAVSKARADAITKELDAITLNGEMSKQAAITSTQSVINGVKDELNKLDLNKDTGSAKIDWARLLGVTDSQLADIRGNLATLGAEASKALSLYLDLQEKTLDKELEAIQKKKEARDQEISELESKLKTEDNLKNDGLANDSQRLKDELAVKKKQQKEALAEEKRIKKEQEKLANDQMLLQEAQQAAALVTAIAQIYASTASGGPVGVVLGTITIAAMLASFAYAQGQASAALKKSDSTSSSFKDGVIDLDGPGTETSDSIKANLSKGESVMTAKETRKFKNLFMGIRKNDSSMIELGISELLKNTGVSLANIPMDLNQAKSNLREAEYSLMYNSNNSGIEKRLDHLTSKFDDLKNQEKVTVLPDGRIMIQKGNDIKYIKPKS